MSVVRAAPIFTCPKFIDLHTAFYRTIGKVYCKCFDCISTSDEATVFKVGAGKMIEFADKYSALVLTGLEVSHNIYMTQESYHKP